MRSDSPHRRSPGAETHLGGVAHVTGVAGNGVILRQGLPARVTHKAALHLLPQELPTRVTCAVVLSHVMHGGRRELAARVTFDGHILRLVLQQSAQTSRLDHLTERLQGWSSNGYISISRILAYHGVCVHTEN